MTDTTPAAVERLLKTLREIGSGGNTTPIPADHRADFHDAADMIAALSSQLEAANQRHAAAIEAVAKSRAEGKAEGLREAANRMAVMLDNTPCYIPFGEMRPFLSPAILAMIPADTPAKVTVQDSFADLVVSARAEAEKAMRKFPQPNYVLLKVAEEAGEVVKAGVHFAEGRETRENVEAEMRQTIAMLYRLWVEGDEVNGVPAIAGGRNE